MVFKSKQELILYSQESAIKMTVHCVENKCFVYHTGWPGGGLLKIYCGLTLNCVTWAYNVFKMYNPEINMLVNNF